MTARFCPYIGLRDDSQTVQEFASRDHVCRHAHPVSAVDLNHQWAFCLGSMHLDCPVFLGPGDQPLPAEIAFRKIKPKTAIPRRTRLIGGLAAGILVLAALLALVLPRFLNQPVAEAAVGLPGTVDASVTVTATHTPSPTATIAPTETLLFVFTQAPSPTIRFCPLPVGWQEYVVKPTDSLLRLSQEYAITIQDLQTANCLGDENLIRSGQRLYVPKRPTETPSLTPTLTPTRYYAPVQPSATRGPGEPRPTNTQPKPTVILDTPVPPTPIPPTEAPTPVPPTDAPTVAP